MYIRIFYMQFLKIALSVGTHFLYRSKKSSAGPPEIRGRNIKRYGLRFKEHFVCGTVTDHTDDRRPVSYTHLDRVRGSKGYSVDEVAAMMRSAIKEAAAHGTAE